MHIERYTEYIGGDTEFPCFDQMRSNVAVHANVVIKVLSLLKNV